MAQRRFGATIVPTFQKHADETSLPAPSFNSPSLTPAASREDFASERRVPPSSPFYQHPQDSFDRGPSRNTSKSNLPVNEKDVEAGPNTPLTPGGPFTSKLSVECSKEDCKMWPSRQTLMESKKAEKKQSRDRKMCGGCWPVVEFWGRFTKKQKLAFKIVLAFFLIGVVVAIAVGITVAVNGTVYVGDGQQQHIPDADKR